MSSIASAARVVIGGVDTHKDLHVAADLNTTGAVIATGSFSTTRAGYRALLRWMRAHGDVRLIGVEGLWQLRQRADPAAAGGRR